MQRKEIERIFDFRLAALPAADLLAEAKAAGEALAAKASVTLEVQDAAGLAPVRADGERVAQVLDYLIGNATKFTPPGGRITIRALTVGSEVQFSIADTGEELGEEDQTRVFAPHWQHDAADHRGRGLGLWICREPVDLRGDRRGARRAHLDRRRRQRDGCDLCTAPRR